MDLFQREVPGKLCCEILEAIDRGSGCLVCMLSFGLYRPMKPLARCLYRRSDHEGGDCAFAE